MRALNVNGKIRVGIADRTIRIRNRTSFIFVLTGRASAGTGRESAELDLHRSINGALGRAVFGRWYQCDLPIIPRFDTKISRICVSIGARRSRATIKTRIGTVININIARQKNFRGDGAEIFARDRDLFSGVCRIIVRNGGDASDLGNAFYGGTGGK